jgi:hypothetical protein
MQEIGGYKVTFGPGENVTIGGRTLTIYEWLKLDVMPSPNYTGSMVIRKARCGGEPEVIAPEHFNALHRALVEHAKSLNGGGEFWIYRKMEWGYNWFEKAIAESEKSFAIITYGEITIANKKDGWHRVPAPWWEVKCMVCGSKILIYSDGRFESSCNGYNQTSCCFITREGNKLIFKKDGKTFTCELKEGNWNPELVEEKKSAIRVKREFCSQCDGEVFYEDKKCRNCGAEFSDE